MWNGQEKDTTPYSSGSTELRSYAAPAPAPSLAGEAASVTLPNHANVLGAILVAALTRRDVDLGVLDDVADRHEARVARRPAGALAHLDLRVRLHYDVVVLRAGFHHHDPGLEIDAGDFTIDRHRMRGERRRRRRVFLGVGGIGKDRSGDRNGRKSDKQGKQARSKLHEWVTYGRAKSVPFHTLVIRDPALVSWRYS